MTDVTDALPAVGLAPTTGALTSEAFYGLFLQGQDSPATADQYATSMRDLGAFLSPQRPLDGAAVTQLLRSLTASQANVLMEGYRTHLRSRELAPATVNARIASVKSWSAWAKRLGLID